MLIVSFVLRLGQKTQSTIHQISIPKVIERVAGELDNPGDQAAAQTPSSLSKVVKQRTPVEAAVKITKPSSSSGLTVAQHNEGSGELMRGNTWFADVTSSFGKSLPDNDDGSDDDGQNDIDADSKGEDESLRSNFVPDGRSPISSCQTESALLVSNQF